MRELETLLVILLRRTDVHEGLAFPQFGPRKEQNLSLLVINWGRHINGNLLDDP